jgi:GR25 family glycosyltransferase involved in LPS biosynthesis
MSSLLNSHYEKIVCINLKERPDKYKFIKERFDKYDIQVEFYHPVIHNYVSKIVKPLIDAKVGNWNVQFPNEFNTMSSFYSVVKCALIDGIQNLFIFEDDFQMHSRWNELLPKYFEKLPQDTDCIMLYAFMSEFTPQNIRINSYWMKAFRSWSHIAIGMNRRYMEEYIKQLDNFPRIADLVSYQMMENGYNFYIAYPVLGIPSKIFSSNIRGTNKNYDKIQNMFTLGLNENNYV